MAKNRWAAALVALVGAAVVISLYRYNQQHYVDDSYIVVNVAALLWLPMLLIFLGLREDPAHFGFALGDLKQGYRLAGLCFLGVLPLLFIASRLPSFQEYYPINKNAELSLAWFAYFELTYGLYLFCWEFFFRGFLLFGLYKHIGWVSVLVQAIAFGIMHFGKVPAEFVVSFLAGIILGVVALRAKSFVPCFVLHWASAVTFDVLIIAAKHHILF